MGGGRSLPSQRDVGEGTSLFRRDAQAQQKGWLSRGVDVERKGHTSQPGLEVRGVGAATPLPTEGAVRRSRPCQGWFGQVAPSSCGGGTTSGCCAWQQSQGFVLQAKPIPVPLA